MNKVWSLDGLLQDEGWLEPAFIEVDKEGVIQRVTSEKPDKEIDEIAGGYALPGYQNAHSHAFQYAMAGLAENLPRQSQSDDFWSWREAMYTLALTLNPDQMEAIATMLYSQMLRHGYTHVVEFHYLHHNPDGSDYENIAEMGSRLLSAAEKTGIRITLVPIFYQMGGFGQKPSERQARFISSTRDDYRKLMEKTEEKLSYCSKAQLGWGIHSLRAVQAQDVVATFSQAPSHCPLHIHVSEQQKEVNDCLAYLGKRPVQWLSDNVEVSKRYHLVHATHTSPEEISLMAQSGAHVVLCPSTEGNLGDGFFSFQEYCQQGGNWSIGTDSHIGLNPNEELRILDYGQRLKKEKRNIICQTPGSDSGDLIFRGSVQGGRRAAGQNDTRFFAPGQEFDAVILDKDEPLIQVTSSERRLATFVYAGDVSWIKGTIVQGKWLVQNQHHQREKEIVAHFQRAMKELSYR